MKKIKVNKGQLLQQKGDSIHKVFMVKSGLLRSYSIDKKGKEHIFMFAPEGWIIADNSLPNQPTQLFIDAIEDSTLIQAEKNEFGEHDTKKLLKRVGVLQNRIIMLMSTSAIERYEHFIEVYAEIVQRVPQRMIASYLGITPEALSTVKRQRKHKK
ncbi:MAG: Crp/Fnr family transcriptional regulator [Bacteroidota bacterium]